MQISGLLLAILILLLSGIFGRMSQANGVCGDGAIETPEQCDDGNLSNGDGCSLSCTRERCGNGTVDSGEQCDDGGTLSGDGCSKFCRIEFCGDTLISAGLSEQCDDGNGLSGDGCSSSCKDETLPRSSSASSVASSAGQDPTDDEPPSAPEPTSSEPPSTQAPETQVTARPVLQQVIETIQFLVDPASEEYRAHLTEAEEGQILQILSKMQNGEPLSDQEKIWAQELLEILTAARSEERARYTDLLEEFIATPISATVVTEKGLEATSLVDVTVPIAIDELNRAIAIIQRGELKDAVMLNLERLQRQGIDLSKILPKNFLDSLKEGARPIDVFTVLKAIKEGAEARATTNLPLSLEVIRLQIALLRESFPVLQQEFGTDPAAFEALLAAIEESLQNATEQNSYGVVVAINQLIDFLLNQNIISLQDLLGADTSLHPAARAARILDATGESVDTAGDIRSLVTGLSDKAPAKYREAFEKGSLEDQQNALIAFLDDDERLSEVLGILRTEGVREFDDRLYVLKQHIQNVGITKDTETLCDDSISDAIGCIEDFLSDVQDAARSRSFFTDFIGRLQDYFGIGQ